MGRGTFRLEATKPSAEKYGKGLLGLVSPVLVAMHSAGTYNILHVSSPQAIVSAGRELGRESGVGRVPHL